MIETPFKSITDIANLQKKNKLSKLSNIKDKEIDSYWDPVNTDIRIGKYKVARQKLHDKFKEFKSEKIFSLKLIDNLLIALILLIWGGFIGWGFFALLVVADINSAMDFLVGTEDEGGFFWVLIFSGMPLLFFRSYVKKIQADLVKEKISKQKKWVYNPSESRLHWRLLSTKFPSIFNKGNKNQNVQDEIWGKYKKGKQKIDFYSGIFEYHRISGSGKHKNRQRYFKTFFGIHLNKKLGYDLILTPNNKVKKIFRALISQKIELESVDFNEIFSIKYDGHDGEKLEIFKLLSPSVQWQLIKLGKKSNVLDILFSVQTFLFIGDEF
jgi:hypothetical protein